MCVLFVSVSGAAPPSMAGMAASGSGAAGGALPFLDGIAGIDARKQALLEARFVPGDKVRGHKEHMAQVLVIHPLYRQGIPALSHYLLATSCPSPQGFSL